MAADWPSYTHCHSCAVITSSVLRAQGPRTPWLPGYHQHVRLRSVEAPQLKRIWLLGATEESDFLANLGWTLYSVLMRCMIAMRLEPELSLLAHLMQALTSYILHLVASDDVSTMQLVVMLLSDTVLPGWQGQVDRLMLLMLLICCDVCMGRMHQGYRA